MVQKIYSKMHLVSCTNTHRDVTDLANHGIVKSTKTWISWERNIIFVQNKKILNLCFRWHIFRNYLFVAEVTFKWSIIFKKFGRNLIYSGGLGSMYVFKNLVICSKVATSTSCRTTFILINKFISIKLIMLFSSFDSKYTFGNGINSR